jgi:predicted Zn-dependent protease
VSEPANNKRLEMLEKMTAGGTTDPFAWYALALEYKKLARSEDALSTFRRLREASPDYVPQYLMCGTLLLEASDPAGAREWLTEGVARARAKGDTHAESELTEALGRVPE